MQRERQDDESYTVSTLLFIYLNTRERTEETQFTVNLAIRCAVSPFIMIISLRSRAHADIVYFHFCFEFKSHHLPPLPIMLTNNKRWKNIEFLILFVPVTEKTKKIYCSKHFVCVVVNRHSLKVSYSQYSYVRIYIRFGVLLLEADHCCLFI